MILDTYKPYYEDLGGKPARGAVNSSQLANYLWGWFSFLSMVVHIYITELLKHLRNGLDRIIKYREGV